LSVLGELLNLWAMDYGNNRVEMIGDERIQREFVLY
jgi:hypothetical protein